MQSDFATSVEERRGASRSHYASLAHVSGFQIEKNGTKGFGALQVLGLSWHCSGPYSR